MYSKSRLWEASEAQALVLVTIQPSVPRVHCLSKRLSRFLSQPVGRSSSRSGAGSSDVGLAHGKRRHGWRAGSTHAARATGERAARLAQPGSRLPERAAGKCLCNNCSPQQQWGQAPHLPPQAAAAARAGRHTTQRGLLPLLAGSHYALPLSSWADRRQLGGGGHQRQPAVV